MAMGAGGDRFLRGLFDGRFSGGDTAVYRRPYHKNCKCDLHYKSRDHCAHTRYNSNTVSYPIRKSWSESSLALMAHAPSSGSYGHYSPAEITMTQTQLVLCREEENGDVNFLISRSNNV